MTKLGPLLREARRKKPESKQMLARCRSQNDSHLLRVRETVARLLLSVGFREGLHAAPGSAIERIMITRPTANTFAHAGFSGASARALSASLLLLGLIGDRRVR